MSDTENSAELAAFMRGDASAENVEAVKTFFAETPPSSVDAVEGELKLMQDAEVWAELHAVREKRNALEGIETELVEEVKRRIKDERGIIQRGAFAVNAKHRSGQTRVDWQRYVVAMMTATAWDALEAEKKMVQQGKMTCDYIKKGEDTIAIEVAKVGK